MGVQTDQTAGQVDGVETKRDRVRRILLVPLGFRFQRGVPDDVAQRRLDRITDDLTYLSDHSLAVLRDMLATKGEGSARNFWPDHATFIGFAEVVQPRPISELPALCSWFGSVEGPRAMEAGSLVETFQFIQRFKKPPVTDAHRRMVAEKVAENRHRLEVVRDRSGRGVAVAPDDRQFADWYVRTEQQCRDIVARERQARGHADG